MKVELLASMLYVLVLSLLTLFFYNFHTTHIFFVTLICIADIKEKYYSDIYKILLDPTDSEWIWFSLHISHKISISSKNYPEVNSCPILLIIFFLSRSDMNWLQDNFLKFVILSKASARCIGYNACDRIYWI